MGRYVRCVPGHCITYIMRCYKLKSHESKMPREGSPLLGRDPLFLRQWDFRLASFVVQVASNSMLKNNVHYSNICCQSDKRGSCGVQPLKPQSAPGIHLFSRLINALCCFLFPRLLLNDKSQKRILRARALIAARARAW